MDIILLLLWFQKLSERNQVKRLKLWTYLGKHGMVEFLIILQIPLQSLQELKHALRFSGMCKEGDNLFFKIGFWRPFLVFMQWILLQKENLIVWLVGKIVRLWTFL